MRLTGLAAIVLVSFLMSDTRIDGQAPAGSLQQFRGTYDIAGGRAGVVRVSDALGGSYTEWTVRFGEPSHELRMFISGPNSDGTFRVWRFEQEPSPAVSNEGTARLEGEELVADFAHVEGPPGKMIRERWRPTTRGLEFVLEASPRTGVQPSRVGGFTAARQ